MPEMTCRKQIAAAAVAAIATLAVTGCGGSANNHSVASSAPPTTSAKPAASRVPQDQDSTTGSKAKGSKPAFGSTPTYASDDGFDISVSPDGQAFTIRFSDIEAQVGASGKALIPIATRVFSLVLPVEGGHDGVDISFGVSGYAFVTEGANAYIVFGVNGEARIESVQAGADNEFVHQLKFNGVHTSEYRMFLFLLVERDSSDPDGAAYLNVSAIDAAINPPVG